MTRPFDSVRTQAEVARLPSRLPFGAVLGLGCLTGSLLLSGCVPVVVAGAAAVGAVAVQEKTFGESVDDAAAFAEIRSKLYSTDRQLFTDVDVEMSEGFVLLSGAVPTEAARADAERIAWTAKQVRNVANELVVGPARSLGEVSADDLITGEVRTRLVGSKVKSVNYNIETYRGVVYLLGVAKDQEELLAAVDIARRVKSVQRVVSYVRVPGPPVANTFAPPAPVAPAAVPSSDIGIEPALPPATDGYAAPPSALPPTEVPAPPATPSAPTSLYPPKPT